MKAVCLETRGTSGSDQDIVMHIFPTCVINLDRSTDRLARISERLNASGISFERLAAIDGQQAIVKGCEEYCNADAISKIGRPLSPGEVGCFLSHLKAIKWFLHTEAPLGMILEDDACPTTQLESSLEHLAQLNVDDFDVVNLGRAPRYRVSMMDEKTGLCIAHYFPVTTTAIVWTRQGAQRFLAESERISQPIDVRLQMWAIKSGRGLAFRAPPCPSDEMDSVIDDSLKQRKGKRSLKYIIKRLRRQFINQWHGNKSVKKRR